MTDTNNKEETFESEIKECLDMCSVNTDWVNKAVKYRFEKLKQLYDKEIKEVKSKLRTCICFKCGSKAINENGFCLDCGCYQ